MYTEKTTSLPRFETAKVETLVSELFYLFEQSGRWYDDMKTMCHRLQRSPQELEAAWQAETEAYQAMTEGEQAAEISRRNKRALAPLGSFTWILELDEFALDFGLWIHTRFEKRGVIIHAFHLGYGEPGRSNDPTMYVLYRPGDEADYDKVHIIRPYIDRSSVLQCKEWVIEPIAAIYASHLKRQQAYG